VKAAELLRLDLPSWSAGPTRKDGGLISARCCSLIYDPDGRLVYAGRAGTGIDTTELQRLWRLLQPLATDKMPLDVPPPRGSRFGSPLRLSRVHWVRPELVAEVKFLTWTDDNLLRQVVYGGLREDKPANEVRRDVPRPKPAS
jgi:bifunctional non-homologous end joining protein LigD